MNSSTHAAPCQWQFKARRLPDPSLYRQPDGSPAPAASAPAAEGASQDPDKLELERGESNDPLKPLKRTASSHALVQPKLTDPSVGPQGPRRRSFSAFFHRQLTKF